MQWTFEMLLILPLLVAIAWMLLGWLPTRALKHHFISQYAATWGERAAWGRRGEAWSAFLALGGPAVALATLLYFGALACVGSHPNGESVRAWRRW